MSLAEKYRPRTFTDVVGQDAVIEKLNKLTGRGLAGRAYFIRGASGTGKSCIARLIAEAIADDINIRDDLVGRSLTPLQVKELRESHRFRGMGKPGRVVIIEEAHGMAQPVIEELLLATDPMKIREYESWIFTTTFDGSDRLFDTKMDAGPLLSRCQELTLAHDGLEVAFAQRLQMIAQAENLDGQPLAAYEALIKSCRCNMRAALMKIEAGDMIVASAPVEKMFVRRR